MIEPGSELSLPEALFEICGLGLSEAELMNNPRFQVLVEIVNLAAQVKGKKAREWFLNPEPELGFVHPATLLRDPANGPKLVKQTLMNHLRGPYAVSDEGKILPGNKPAIKPKARQRRIR